MIKTVIIGIGNPWMGDDGIGPYVISLLEEKPLGVDLISLYTPSYSLITYLQGCEKAIVVDCAQFGASPGEIRRAKRSEMKNLKHSAGLDLHAVDLLTVFDYAAELGIAPQEVIFYCIEPKSLSSGEALSDEMKRAALEVVDRIRKEVETN